VLDFDCAKELADAACSSDINRDCRCIAAYRVCGTLGGFELIVPAHNDGAVSGESLRRSLAYAGARADHDGYAAVESKKSFVVHRPPL
jgi:hypothetical protein